MLYQNDTQVVVNSVVPEDPPLEVTITAPRAIFQEFYDLCYYQMSGSTETTLRGFFAAITDSLYQQGIHVVGRRINHPEMEFKD